MIGVKITNVVGPRGGNFDYKGMDPYKFVAGSQVYPSGTLDFYGIYEKDDIPEHEDIHIISEAEYAEVYNAEYERQREPGPIEKLQEENAELRKQIDAMQLALIGIMDTAGGNA